MAGAGNQKLAGGARTKAWRPSSEMARCGLSAPSSLGNHEMGTGARDGENQPRGSSGLLAGTAGLSA